MKQQFILLLGFLMFSQVYAQAQAPCSCTDFFCSNTELPNWVQPLVAGQNLWQHNSDGKADALGSSWGSRHSIASSSLSDGAWVLDKNAYYLTNSISSVNVSLTSPPIDISCYTSTTLFLSFHQYYRAYNSATTIDYSFDNGTTWTSQLINSEVLNNTETATYDYKIIPIDIPPLSIGLSTSIMVRFSHTGIGYFWILDDIKICDQYPSKTRPNPALGKFLHENKIVPGSSLPGIDIALKQSYEVDMYGHAYVPNQLVIKLDSVSPQDTLINLPNGDFLKQVDACQCYVLHSYKYISTPSPGGYPTTNGKSLSIEEKIEGPKNTNRVRDVEPNYYVFNELEKAPSCVTPSTTGLTNLFAYPHLTLNPGSGFKIAILDTGIDPTDQSLANRILVHSLSTTNGSNLIGRNFINNNNNVLDDHGHGTHVAGIINNTLNTYFNNNCNIKFEIYKTHDDLGMSTLFASTCGLYCVGASGAKVVNCSWGYYAENLENASIMYDALEKLNDQGVILLASAGNDSILVDTPNIHIPSSFTSNILPQEFESLDYIISVASTGSSGIASPFSNYSNQYVDIAAIGEEIESNGLCGKLATKSGTSMSTPVVTAAIANHNYCLAFGQPPTEIINTVFNECAYATSDLPSTTGTALLYHLCQNPLHRNSENAMDAHHHTDDTEFNVYPNPFVNQLSIDITSDKPENATVEIHDFLGRLLYKKNTILEKGVNTLNINLESFNESLFSLQVKTDKSLFVKTLTKVR